MTREEAEAGPRFEFLGPEYEDGLVTFRNKATGRISVGVAEFVRLANADAANGERSRACGDYS